MSWQVVYAKVKEYTDEMNRQYINEKARRIIAEMSLQKILKPEEVLKKYEDWYRENYNDSTVILHPFYVEKFLGQLEGNDDVWLKAKEYLKDFGNF